MAAMTQPVAPFAETRHGLATTAALVFFFWLFAASGAAAAQMHFQSAVATVAAIAAILLAACCYTQFCARHAGITHALGVGSVWLVLGIVAEVVLQARFAVHWCAVLGSPDRPLLRNILFFVWIFAPALFARREDGD